MPYTPVDSRVTRISPIVRDMQSTAKELGIVRALQDALLFNRDDDKAGTAERIVSALRALGLSPEDIAADIKNHRSFVG